MSAQTQDTRNDETPRKGRVKPLQVIASVLAAAFGVQSRKNRERDFQEGSFIYFLIAGLIGTVLFVGTMYLIVSTVLENAR